MIEPHLRLNMSKVFKIGQDLRESEYLISLWMKLLVKLENAHRTGTVEPSILTHVRTLIRSNLWF